MSWITASARTHLTTVVYVCVCVGLWRAVEHLFAYPSTEEERTLLAPLLPLIRLRDMTGPQLARTFV